MAVISQRMKKAAQEFERAAIDAGFGWAKIVYESPKWSVHKYGALFISAMDDDGKPTTWTEGE